MIPLPQRHIETFPGVPQALLSRMEMAKTNADARGYAAAVSLKLTENALKSLSSLSAFGALRKLKPGRTGLMSYICHEIYCPQPSPAQRCPEHQEATCVSCEWGMYDWVKHTSHPNVRSI